MKDELFQNVMKLALLTGLALVLSFLFYIIYPQNTMDVSAQTGTSTTYELAGYAWSDNIGWIKFSPGPNFKVTIDVSGYLKGYAWSDNIGWVKFGDMSGFPVAGDTNARLVNDKITGFARACAGTIGGDCNSSPRTDGWDGWIRLSGDSFGVTVSGPTLSGFAWGDVNVGWIDFSGVSRSVVNPPLEQFNAECVSINAPDSVVKGNSLTTTIKMKNTGSESWTASNYKLKVTNLTSHPYSSNSNLSVSTTTTIATNGTADFVFSGTATTSPGNYNQDWKMFKPDGTGFGGSCSKNIIVTAGTASCAPPAQLCPDGSCKLDCGGGDDTCSDGIKNGNETGVDTGGRCDDDDYDDDGSVTGALTINGINRDRLTISRGTSIKLGWSVFPNSTTGCKIKKISGTTADDISLDTSANSITLSPVKTTKYTLMCATATANLDSATVTVSTGGEN